MPLNEIAYAILSVQRESDGLREKLKGLDEQEEILREQMLAGLKEERMKSYRDEQTPLTFSRITRSSLAVTNVRKALKWAVGRSCISVDTKRAAILLRGTGALPEGFEQREVEYLSVKPVA